MERYVVMQIERDFGELHNSRHFTDIRHLPQKATSRVAASPRRATDFNV